MNDIIALQNIIERNAAELKRVKKEKKLILEQQKSIIDNDVIVSELTEQIEPINQNIKERKAKLKNNSEFARLKAKKREISEEEKELSETLSNHLTNYYQQTGAKSVPTSDGNEVGFKIKSNFSSKQLELF